MRIFYYNRLLNEPVGGGLHARGLVRAFRQLGHEVTCWPREILGETESVVGRYRHLPEIVRVPGLDVRARYRVLLERDDVLGAMKHSSCDVLLARRAAYDYTLDAVVAAVSIPVIAEVNGVLSKETWINGGERFLPWERSRERSFLARADRVVCVSEDVVAQVVESIGYRPPIVVVNNGVDSELFSPDTVCDGATLGWSQGRDAVFGYCGSLSANHDPSVLSTAVEEVAKENHGYGFLFVGPTADELRSHGFSEAVLSRSLATGLLPHSAIPGVLACADVYMGALKHSHGSPLKLFEYMSLGRPVVFAAAGQTAQVIVDSGCGLVSGEGDASTMARNMETAASADSVARAVMGERGREWVTKHGTWRIVAASMIDGISGTSGESVGEHG